MNNSRLFQKATRSLRKTTRQFFLRPLNQFWIANRGPILLVALVVIPIKSSLADWNWVPTGSMNPGIQEGDLIFVNKTAYDVRIPLTLHRLHRHADPDRGDIVVCFSPGEGTRLVKRVVAVPGDTVEMRRNHLHINGESADYCPAAREDTVGLRYELTAAAAFAEETVLGHSRVVMALPSAPNSHRDFPPITIPEGQFFVVGDNRDNSRDSRYFGTIPRHLIVGEAKAVILSFDKYCNLKPKFSRWFTELD